MSENAPREFFSPSCARFQRNWPRKSPINEWFTVSCPMILEGNQPRIVFVRPAHIELTCIGALRVLDRSPQQQWHSAKVVVSCVRTAVLIDNGISKPQG